MLATFERRGVIKEIFVWSALSSPSELREVYLPQFEAAMKTLLVDLKGPFAEGEWVLKFKDLERPTKVEGVYEETIYHVYPHGPLWEIYTLESAPRFRRTIDALIRFTSMLDYVLIPPSFMKNLMKAYDPNQELVAFRAQRDYFSVEVGNPHETIRRDFADLRYKSANVPEDFVTLVVERPVGPLLLTSADIVISYGYSEKRSCRIRLEINGKLRQVHRGDKDIFREVRANVIKFLITRFENVAERIPISQIEEFKDSETGIQIISKNILQQSSPILVKLSRKVSNADYLRLKGLFSQNFRESKFLGAVEREISESSCLIRTTDMLGGGSALIQVDINKDNILIHSLPTTTIRTIDRVYHTFLEKFDVDSILAMTSASE